MTLDETVQKELDAARGYAEQGNALAMGGSLDLAKIYAGRVNQNIFARVIDFVKVYGEVGKVRRIGYKASFPVELAAAGVCAEQGSVSDMAKHLALAKEYAWQVAQNIFEQVEQIEGTGYAKAFPFELAAAGVCAEQGSVSDMAKHLALAKKYAGKVGRGIFEEVAEVRRIGYETAVPIELAAARVCAKQGSVSDMAKHLALARKYAGKVGRGIFEEVAEVRRDFNLRV